MTSGLKANDNDLKGKKKKTKFLPVAFPLHNEPYPQDSLPGDHIPTLPLLQPETIPITINFLAVRTLIVAEF